MGTAQVIIPRGWSRDEDSGALVRDTIHHMGRRCLKWDYSGRGTYQITIALANRHEPLLGELRFDASCGGAFVAKSELGLEIEACVHQISQRTPEIEVLGVCVMPDHVHFVLRVCRRLPTTKPLGYVIRGFKGGATTIYWRHLGFSAKEQIAPLAPGHQEQIAPLAPGHQEPAAPVVPGLKRPGALFAPGYVDTILFDQVAVDQSLAYLADNPRRLWEKRAHPELFRVLRDLRVDLAGFGPAHFSAIGNHHLLAARPILQVQCSRRHFAYARDQRGHLLKNAAPTVITPAFCLKRDTLLAAAQHGAVLVSPCISEGEREIARLALAAGARVITLANKGFSPLYKPGGKLFDTCAAGNLLMLAPIGWPYLPGEKKITRLDACVLNYLASQIAGSGAVEIIYQGLSPEHLAASARAAMTLPASNGAALNEGFSHFC